MPTFVLSRFLIALALCLATLAARAEAPPVDDLGVESRTSETLRLSELKGKVVAISFWASWCGPCLKELPVLESIQQQIPKSELRIISINFGEDRKLFRRHLRQLAQAEIALVHDARKRVGKAFGVESLPFLVLIDHRGQVREIKRGYSEQSLPALIELMNGLLEERALDTGGRTGP
ncbi:MAG: TlpA family protein disulfide reductase [Lysobacterales bacterium]